MKSLITLAALILLASNGHAQNTGVAWSRAPRAAVQPERVFHATVVANLPTAETLQKGFSQFEISHRFLPSFSGGFEQLWGLDGPVNIRLGLGYGITDRLMLTLTRSNVRDNIDLQLKYGFAAWRAGDLPVRLGVVGGAAWNTDVPWRTGTSGRDFQGYAQAILNLLPARRWAVGLVPTFLYNAYLESDDVERVLTLGLYSQWYVSHLVSLLAEWNIAESRFGYVHDAVAVGIELETGGHFFKIVATNSTALDPSQFVIGSSDAFEPDRWRLGFNITRLLKF